MATTKINIGGVLGGSRSISSARTTVTNVKSSFNSTKNQIDYKIMNRNNLNNRFTNVSTRLGAVESKISKINATVNNCVNQYNNTEQDVLKWSREITQDYNVTGTVNPAIFFNIVDLFEKTKKNKIDEKKAVPDEQSGFAKFVNNKLKKEGSVLSGEVTNSGEFLGVNTAGRAEGSILHGEVGLKNNASWKIKDEDGNWNKTWGLSTIAYATGSVAQGEVEGNFGYLHGKAEGKALTGAIEGEAKLSLYNDGEFNPSVSVGGKASVSALQGEAQAGFGTDQYGVYIEGEGDVLHAEAEAGVGAGYIGKDEDGNSIYGVSAKASAMASVAQGEIKGGITLFGIDIDVGVNGYALAAGVETGGSVSTEGVTASLSGALGLGAGVTLDVDWSDAEWVGDTIDAVGDFAVDTWEFVGDTADAVADAAGDFASGVADAAQGVGDFLFGWI